MGCHGEKSTAKYFDLRNEEKKTTGILADGVKKIWKQEENPAENEA